MSTRAVVAVDVGSRSVRAAAVACATGEILAYDTHDISVFHASDGVSYAQDSGEIWNATCRVVRKVGKAAGVDVVGIGFDATCSLVVLDAHGEGLPVCGDGRDQRGDIVMWMDHRAKAEAEKINETKHEVLSYVGGQISPEMQLPKLLWLKKYATTTWGKAKHFMDLSDFLTFKATACSTRSICTTTCKWTFQARASELGETKEWDVSGWSDSFFAEIGLTEFVDDRYERIGQRIVPVGTPIGAGLCASAAEELGLPQDIPVAAGLIDAHAGALGILECPLKTDTGEIAIELDERMAMICGTSSCHLVLSEQDDPRFVPGVWGPYRHAILKEKWLLEAGQSATGSLLQYCIDSHPASQDLRDLAKSRHKSPFDILSDRLYELVGCDQTDKLALLARGIHVLPYHHGDRSPRADPTLVGQVVGLTLDTSIESLALYYLGTLLAVIYGTRHIIETIQTHAQVNFQALMCCGGMVSNRLFLQLLADVTGKPIVLSAHEHPMLVGVAMGASTAANVYPDLRTAMRSMHIGSKTIQPHEDADGELGRFHRAKYDVYMRMYEDQLAYRQLMNM